jgi:hypothetical protein
MGTTLKFLSENTVRKCTFGNTREEIIEGISSEIEDLWDVMVLQDDALLNENTKAIKRKLTSLVKEVKTP